MFKYIPFILLLFISYGCENKGNTLDNERNEHEGNHKPHTIEHDYPEIPIDQDRNRNEWVLVWNDEFHDEASLLNWNLQDWPSDKNGEWQYYSPSNINVHDDLLRIESRIERYKGREYTSGAVTTEGHI